MATSVISFPLDLLANLCQHLADPKDRSTLLSVQRTCYSAWKYASPIIYEKVILRDQHDTASFFSVFANTDSSTTDRGLYVSKFVKVVYFEYWNARDFGMAMSRAFSTLDINCNTLFPNGIGIHLGQKAMSSIAGFDAGGASRRTDHNANLSILEHLRSQHAGQSTPADQFAGPWSNLFSIGCDHYQAIWQSLQLVLHYLMPKHREICLYYPRQTDCPPDPRRMLLVPERSSGRKALLSVLLQANIPVLNVHLSDLGNSHSFAWPGNVNNVYLPFQVSINLDTLSELYEGIEMALLVSAYERDSRWRIGRALSGAARLVDFTQSFIASSYTLLSPERIAKRRRLLDSIGTDLIRFADPYDMGACRVCGCE